MCANLAFFACSTALFSIAQMIPCVHLVKLIFSQVFQNHWFFKLLHLPLFWNINHVGIFKDLFHLVDYFKDNLFFVNTEFPIPKNYNLLSIQRFLKFFIQPHKQVISISKCHCFNVVKGTNLFLALHFGTSTPLVKLVTFSTSFCSCYTSLVAPQSLSTNSSHFYIFQRI